MAEEEEEGGEGRRVMGMDEGYLRGGNSVQVTCMESSPANIP